MFSKVSHWEWYCRFKLWVFSCVPMSLHAWPWTHHNHNNWYHWRLVLHHAITAIAVAVWHGHTQSKNRALTTLDFLSVSPRSGEHQNWREDKHEGRHLRKVTLIIRWTCLQLWIVNIGRKYCSVILFYQFWKLFRFQLSISHRTATKFGR